MDKFDKMVKSISKGIVEFIIACIAGWVYAIGFACGYISGVIKSLTNKEL